MSHSRPAIAGLAFAHASECHRRVTRRRSTDRERSRFRPEVPQPRRGDAGAQRARLEKLAISPPAFVKHEGRISIIDPAGNVRTLLSRLPAGLDLDNLNPAGPTGLALAGEDTLYIQIGIGDVLKRNATNQEVPNPAGLSSALFSSIWRVRFSTGVDALAAGFALDPATDYAMLADGLAVELTNDAGESATVEVVADIRDLIPGANVVMGSNPFGLLVRGRGLYFADSGYNSISVANARNGRQQTITHFPPVPNTAPFGPPVSQAVPNSIRGVVGRGHLAMVTLFTGFPFGPGASSVRLVNLKTGEQYAARLRPDDGHRRRRAGTRHRRSARARIRQGVPPPGPGGPAMFVTRAGSCTSPRRCRRRTCWSPI